jgi:hypothetical protein
MDAFQVLEKTVSEGRLENYSEMFDVFIECSAIAMEQYNPKFAEDRAALENELDISLIHEIFRVGAGINLGDDSPNLVAAG